MEISKTGLCRVVNLAWQSSRFGFSHGWIEEKRQFLLYDLSRDKESFQCTSLDVECGLREVALWMKDSEFLPTWWSMHRHGGGCGVNAPLPSLCRVLMATPLPPSTKITGKSAVYTLTLWTTQVKGTLKNYTKISLAKQFIKNRFEFIWWHKVGH